MKVEYEDDDSFNYKKIKNFSQEILKDLNTISYYKNEINQSALTNKDFSKLRKKQKQKIKESNLFLKHFHKNNLRKISEKNLYTINKSQSSNQSTLLSNYQHSSNNLNKHFISPKKLTSSQYDNINNHYFLTLTPIKTSKTKLKNLKKFTYNNSEIYKQKYGKLSLFKEQHKTMRQQKYINNLLENELYFKKVDKGIKPKIIGIAEYKHKINQKLFNDYSDEFNNYYRKTVIDVEKEKIKNESLLYRKNEMKNEINRLLNKKDKLMKKLENLMDMKKFLLCVKEKCIFIDKLSNESKNEIRKDEERKQLIINNYTIKKNRKCSVISPVKISKKSCLKSLSVSPKSKSTGSSNTKINFSLTKEFHYYPIENKNIFESVEEFERIFKEINDSLANYLTKYNSLETKLSCIQSKYKEMEKEKKEFIAIYSKRINEDIHIKSEKIEILKNKYEELVKMKKKLINDIEYKTELISNILEEKIEIIFQNLNIKIENKYWNDNKNINILKLQLIENNYNKYIKEKEYFKNKYPEEYKKAYKMIILNNRLNLIKKKNKLDKEERENKVKVIINRQNKIYFLPFRKNNFTLETKEYKK